MRYSTFSGHVHTAKHGTLEYFLFNRAVLIWVPTGIHLSCIILTPRANLLPYMDPSAPVVCMFGLGRKSGLIEFSRVSDRQFLNSYCIIRYCNYFYIFCEFISLVLSPRAGRWFVLTPKTAIEFSRVPDRFFAFISYY